MTLNNAQPGPELSSVKDLADQCGKVAVQLKEKLERTSAFVCSRPATAAESPKQGRADLHGTLEDTLHCLRSALQDAQDLSRLLGAEPKATSNLDQAFREMVTHAQDQDRQRQYVPLR